MSKFADKLQPFIDFQTQVLAARDCRRRAVWSTTGAESFQALLDKFDSTDANLAFDKLYAADQKGTGSSAGQQSAVRNQVHLLAAIRRAVRAKMAVGADARSFSSLDFDRHDLFNRGVLVSKLNRLLDSPEINPQSVK